MQKRHKIYIIAISTYLVLIAIAMLTCFLLNVQGVVYIVTIIVLSVLFCIVFLSTCYNYLYKINEDDVEAIKSISKKLDIDKLKMTLVKKGFVSIADNRIFYKTFPPKTSYSKYIYLSTSDNFEISIENFFRELENEKIYEKKNCEVYVLIVSDYDSSSEVYKENRTRNLHLTDTALPLNRLLTKCIVYNLKEQKFYYFNNKTNKKAAKAVEFIVDEIIE